MRVAANASVMLGDQSDVDVVAPVMDRIIDLERAHGHHVIANLSFTGD